MFSFQNYPILISMQHTYYSFPVWELISSTIISLTLSVSPLKYLTQLSFTTVACLQFISSF